MDSNIKYWLWLSTRRGLSPRMGISLYEAMDRSIQQLFLAEEDVLSCYDLSPQVLGQLLDKKMDAVLKIMEECQKENIHVITYQDAIYPNKLQNLVDPPLVLYGKGRLPLLDDSLSLAVVGARNASPPGVQEATELALTLNKAGAFLITGMAEGIDSAVVEGALKGGAPLVSVVAGGIDRPYPRENGRFYQDVATVGVVLSEYPPGTAHMGRHFRPRNRILSGLSNGVLVVECTISGGTMMTATIAEEQGRDLFAMPGPIRSPNSRGPHRLIQHHGAYLITSGQDILEFYQYKFPLLQQKAMSHTTLQARVGEATPYVPVKEPMPPRAKKKAPSAPVSAPAVEKATPTTRLSVAEQGERFTEDQIQLLTAIGSSAHTVDGMVELTQIPANRVLTGVTMLEMDGALKEISSGLYQSQVVLEPR